MYVFLHCSLEREERVLQEKKKSLQERMRRSANTPHSAATTSFVQSASTERVEAAAAAAAARGEGVMMTAGHGGQGTVQRDKMEKRVKEELFKRPLQNSVTSTPTAATTASLSYHNSYHGETGDQLRNRSRTPAWENNRYTSTGAYHQQPTPSTYPATHCPQAVPTSPPSFTPSPSPVPPSSYYPTPSSAHNPPTGPSSQQRSLHHQNDSQEWTEYTSAQTASSQTQPSDCTAQLSPPPSSSHGPDVSEFDPMLS